MTELSFLTDLFLNHKLLVATKKHIAERIKDVEATIAERIKYLEATHVPRPQAYQAAPLPPIAVPQNLQGQSASTIANMMKHGVIPNVQQETEMGPAPIDSHPPGPVAIVAQTPATAAALASRQEAIAQAMSGKIDKMRGRPRKF